VASLSEFQKAGGEIVIVDTGSVDNTPQIARDLGCTVVEEGPIFMRTIDETLAKNINERFVDNEPSIVQPGDRLFEFSTARNYAACLAKNDWVCMVDCDEVLTRVDLEGIEKALATPNVGRVEFEFVYAHDQFGQPVVQFRMSRFYNREKFWWNPDCIVHEILTARPGQQAETVYVGPDVLKSDHWQNEQTNRSGYLVGLALDCFLHPDNDRNSHYFGRELFYKGRYKSAIKEFQRHIAMNGWPVERAQSMVYIGDCCKALGDESGAISWWNQAFLNDGTRREPLMRLAHHFFSKDDKHKTAAYASAALALPRIGAYMDNENHYRQEPHELLYWATWYLGDKVASAAHWRRAIGYQPLNGKFLSDSQFYLTPGLGLVAFQEAIKAQQPFSFVKLGDGERECMSGKPGQNCDSQPYSLELARALASSYASMAGKVHIVDFENQKAFNLLLNRTDNDMAAVKSFWETVSAQAVLKVFIGPERLRAAAKFLKAKFVPVPLIDSFSAVGHTCKQVFDLAKPGTIFVFSAGMASKILIAELLKRNSNITCLDAGSAFDPLFVGNTRTFQASKADLELLYFGTRSAEVPKSEEDPHVTICIPTLGREEKLKTLLQLIPFTAQYKNFDVLVEHDSFEKRIGVPKLVKKMVDKAKGEFIVFMGTDCIPHPGWLREAMNAMRSMFPAMDGLVGLNDGLSNGKENPHWLASKNLLPMLDGEFFHTGYSHVGCDNELTARCKKAGKYVWCREAVVYHDHPLWKGCRDEDVDATYALAWRSDLVEKDRALLQARAKQFGFEGV
jgi:glycosyltransferase involved in cell wall biosynthesis